MSLVSLHVASGITFLNFYYKVYIERKNEEGVNLCYIKDEPHLVCPGA